MSSGESCACAVPSERPKMVPSTHPVIRTAANPRPIAHSLLKHALIKFPLTANVKSSAQPHARAPTGCRTPPATAIESPNARALTANNSKTVDRSWFSCCR